jgi:hypothetical protein
MFTDEITERKAKLNKLCTEQNLALVIDDRRYPIRFTMMPIPSEQTTMDADTGEVVDGGVIKVIFQSHPVVKTTGSLTIGADDLKKIITVAKELQYFMLQQFFYKKANTEE